MANIYHYFVEGEGERAIINALKTDLQCIQAGKVDVFNVIQNKLNKNMLMRLKKGTIVVLVFDTDKDQTDILDENIRFLKKQSHIKNVICIPEVRSLEDELICSCNIKNVKELMKSKSNSEYKKDLAQCRNLSQVLMKYQFDIEMFWNKDPMGAFAKYKNDSKLIKR